LGIIDAQLDSPYVRHALEGLAKNTINNYHATLRQFLRFVNSKKELKKEIKIDDLVREAKADITKTEEKIDLFFKWLIPSLLLTATLIIIIY
jgi:site-specific recombinase XerD